MFYLKEMCRSLMKVLFGVGVEDKDIIEVEWLV